MNPHRGANVRRRGGTHRIRDEHRTGTRWDRENYKTLRNACRENGIFMKDMPKHQMIRSLAENDKRKHIAKVRADREAKQKAEAARKKRLEEEKAKERERLQEEERKAAKEQRKEAGDDVSDTTEIIQEAIMAVGEFFSDSSESSSEIESSTQSTVSLTFPHQRLRIFEWSYHRLPWVHLPRQAHVRMRKTNRRQPSPRRIPYLPMALVTSLSHESLRLPGSTTKGSVGADFVPKVSQFTINCARNGVMVGTLRKAIIERGVDWAERTRVQGWNGRMYLELPPRSSDIPLAEVYSKWSKIKQTHSKALKATHPGTNKDQKRIDRNGIEKSMVLELFASSEYRPPICYLPAYLDYPYVVEQEGASQNLQNLYYIRFPGNSLPHFYFWVREGEWSDPTKPNPQWRSARIEDEALELEEKATMERVAHQQQLRLYARNFSPPLSLDMSKKMVKRSSVPSPYRKGAKRLPNAATLEDAVLRVERQIYNEGFGDTLFRHREKWLQTGKQHQWELLTVHLPRLYPSGELPNAPLVCNDEQKDSRTSLAEKIVSVQHHTLNEPISPIRGNEPWTRNDSLCWEVVDVVTDDGVEDSTNHLVREVGSSKGMDTMSLHRSPSSMGTPHSFRKWLDNLSPSLIPPSSDDDEWVDVPDGPSGADFRAMERQEWETRFLHRHSPLAQRSSNDGSDRRSSLRAFRRYSYIEDLETDFESMPVLELQYQIYNLRRRASRTSFCPLCLESFYGLDKNEKQDHFQEHHDESSRCCPFCGSFWAQLNSALQAEHIFSHDYDDVIHQSLRRPSSVFSADSVRLFSIAAGRQVNNEDYSVETSLSPQIITRSQSRKASIRSSQSRNGSATKVQFSPHIEVGKRIAYNDFSDMARHGAEEDDPLATSRSSSSRKSSLKHSVAHETTEGKRHSVIDTARGSGGPIAGFQLSRKRKAQDDQSFTSSGSKCHPSENGSGSANTDNSNAATPRSKRLRVGQQVADLLPPLAPGSDPGSHHSSTVSNASTSSNRRRQAALGSAELDVLSICSENIDGSETSTQTYQNNTAFVGPEQTIIDSVIPEISDVWNEDYIKFDDDEGLLLEDPEDALMGNPFAPPPKVKGKAGKKGKKKILKASNIGLGIQSSALFQPFSDPSSGDSAMRLGRRPSTRRPSNNKGPKTIGLETVMERVGKGDDTLRGSYNIIPDESSHARVHRSAAPTPSPSLLSHLTHRTDSISPRLSPSKMIISDDRTIKRLSIDVPFSDARPIVPPNTPAPRVINRKGVKLPTQGTLETTVDIDMLNDKISGIKTTRGGTARELPTRLNGTSGRKRKAVDMENDEVTQKAAVKRARLSKEKIASNKKKRNEKITTTTVPTTTRVTRSSVIRAAGVRKKAAAQPGPASKKLGKTSSRTGGRKKAVSASASKRKRSK